MTQQREALATRIRELLRGLLTGRDVREVKMFGGLSLMVDDKLVVSAGRDGDLLVRVDPARHEEFLELPGARDSFMGNDRLMGPGWITVGSAYLETTETLEAWVNRGLEWRAAQD